MRMKCGRCAHIEWRPMWLANFQWFGLGVFAHTQLPTTRHGYITDFHTRTQALIHAHTRTCTLARTHTHTQHTQMSCVTRRWRTAANRHRFVKSTVFITDQESHIGRAPYLGRITVRRKKPPCSLTHTHEHTYTKEHTHTHNHTH